MKTLIIAITFMAAVCFAAPINVRVSIPALNLIDVPASIDGLGTKVSQYPNVTTLQTNWLLLIADPVQHTNYNISYGDLTAGLPNVLTNTFVLLQVVTNNTDNLTVTNGLTNLALSASQFVATDAGKKLVSTLNGTTLTNLTYQYPTNAIPANAILTIGSKYYTTNLTTDITLPAPSIGNTAFYESSVLQITNGDSATHTVTLTGITGQFGVCPALFYCTNAHQTKIVIDHGGPLYTNAWKIDL